MRKESVETINSIFWFGMDAMWMLEFVELSSYLAFPTVISGVALIFMERKKDAKLIDIAMFFWMGMNITWLYSEIYDSQALLSSNMLTVSKVCFVFGALFIFLALIISPDRQRITQKFKRLRI